MSAKPIGLTTRCKKLTSKKIEEHDLQSPAFLKSNTSSIESLNHGQMKKFMTTVGASLFALVLLVGCNLFQSEDDRIKEALIGRYYQEDEVDDDGTIIKDINGEFFANGEFEQQATAEIIDEETFEIIDMKITITGEWTVRDKFIYYTFNYDELEITPEIFMVIKGDLIQELKDKNTPEKVVEYDASRIILEDADGEKYTMKKSY